MLYKKYENYIAYCGHRHDSCVCSLFWTLSQEFQNWIFNSSHIQSTYLFSLWKFSTFGHWNYLDRLVYKYSVFPTCYINFSWTYTFPFILFWFSSADSTTLYIKMLGKGPILTTHFTHVTAGDKHAATTGANMKSEKDNFWK